MIAISRNEDSLPGRHHPLQLPTPSDVPRNQSPLRTSSEKPKPSQNDYFTESTGRPHERLANSLEVESRNSEHEFSTIRPATTILTQSLVEEDTNDGRYNGESAREDLLGEPTKLAARKLSKEQILELAASPLSSALVSPSIHGRTNHSAMVEPLEEIVENNFKHLQESSDDGGRGRRKYHRIDDHNSLKRRQPLKELRGASHIVNTVSQALAPRDSGSRPLPARTVSTPPLGARRKSSNRHEHRSGTSKVRPKSPAPLDISASKRSININGAASTSLHSPDLHGSSAPMPPLSIPTYLQLELDADRQLSGFGDSQFESAAAKFERLKDFLLLPAPLEHILWFGTFACIDAWLSVFTILPLRFLKALWILIRWWTLNAWKELRYLVEFVYLGIGRFWRRSRNPSLTSAPSSRASSLSRLQSRRSLDAVPESPGVIHAWPAPPKAKGSLRDQYQHKRTRSTPSLLLASHKADLLKGLLVLGSSIALLQLDPSRMYHSIRGQAAIKLYVIYNGLEVGDRLLSAIGQDVLECLFSREVLDRKPDGRSRVVRPAWMFVVALLYNIVHAACLLYQVITLNVAVNSYSNALLTLLLSNQFVEIKAAVFKKIEKDNLFQLTCADIVERFQLWLMLLIIAMRNMVEIGGISISISNSFDSTSANPGSNSTNSAFSSRIWPSSFAFLPRFTAEILTPFIVVLGSEMVVDWIKHAYIGKFNDTKPRLYGRYLDILAKDYYTHAFGDQNLMKRIGLPVLPLACLFVRAAIQTYHMFLATHMPLPLPSTATSLSVESASASSTPATRAALGQVDHLIRRALGRASFPLDSTQAPTSGSYYFDDTIAFALLLLVLIVVFLLLLAAKLILGMVMLRWARSRYKGMKERERARTDVGGKRLGVSAMVEVDDEKRKYIYEDDAKGYQLYKAKEEKQRKAKESEQERGRDLSKVTRYDMVAKRIW